MVNTGARVQEVVELDVSHVVLGPSPRVRLHGKGNKIRDCPLWDQTRVLLEDWLRQRGDLPAPDSPLFPNARGARLSRWGIAYILRIWVKVSGITLPNARANAISPHTIRHTTAMELLHDPGGPTPIMPEEGTGRSRRGRNANFAGSAIDITPCPGSPAGSFSRRGRSRAGSRPRGWRGRSREGRARTLPSTGRIGGCRTCFPRRARVRSTSPPW